MEVIEAIADFVTDSAAINNKQGPFRGVQPCEDLLNDDIFH